MKNSAFRRPFPPDVHERPFRIPPFRALTPPPFSGIIGGTMKNEYNPEKLQPERNQALLDSCRYMHSETVSSVPPLQLDIAGLSRLSEDDITLFEALQIDAARIAIESVASLSKINEVDHMGGGLDMIPPLLLTLSIVNRAERDFTIENAHTSIGYYSALAALGFLDRQYVVDSFRRGLDIPGHVSWVPGGTQLNGGRLGVMIPAAVGQALGKRAAYGSEAWVLCHCGDAGWISGQALNGFHAAKKLGAPVSFIMHRNGIQLSGTTAQMTGADPRPILESLGVQILETPSLYEAGTLWQSLREARSLARNGVPSLIYPVGKTGTTLAEVAERFGIAAELEAFAAKNGVPMDTVVWLPGCLMSYRDLPSMMECLFFVNGLPGGKAHHDGHMKGRDAAAVLNQSVGTLGRALIEGAREVKLFGEEIGVRAEIRTLKGLSGHADMNGLIDWVDGFNRKPSQVFVVHGDDTVTDSFAKTLGDRLNLNAYAPYSGTRYDLARNMMIYEAKGIPVQPKRRRSSTRNSVFERLLSAGQRLISIIRGYEHCANKDIAKFADQINSLCDKWE